MQSLIIAALLLGRSRMFESIFSPYGVHKHRSAPLLHEREEFLLHLQRRGTGPVCLRIYASRLNQIVRFLNLTSLRRVIRVARSLDSVSSKLCLDAHSLLGQGTKFSRLPKIRTWRDS